MYYALSILDGVLYSALRIGFSPQNLITPSPYLLIIFSSHPIFLFTNDPKRFQGATVSAESEKPPEGGERLSVFEPIVLVTKWI